MGRTDTASRVVDAVCERVFEALTDPRALVEWLPPTGMTGRFDHFDARPGGAFRMTLTYVDPPVGGGKSSAESDVVEGRYIDVVPGALVVQECDFASDDAAFAGTMTLTWRLTDVEGRTRVDICAVDVPAGISATDHVAGLNSSLDNLALYLVDAGT